MESTMPILTEDRQIARLDAIKAMRREADGYDHEPNEDDWLNWCDGLDEDC